MRQVPDSHFLDTVSFKYDPFGRRIYKSSASSTSIYAYDGDNLVEESNSSGAAAARYSQGLNIDEPLSMLRSSATSYYCRCDYRKSWRPAEMMTDIYCL